jgi:hypothetical protein
VDGNDVDDLSRNFHLIVFIGALYGLLASGVLYLGQGRVQTMVSVAIVLAAFHVSATSGTEWFAAAMPNDAWRP